LHGAEGMGKRDGGMTEGRKNDGETAGATRCGCPGRWLGNIETGKGEEGLGD
jgi:hypothetical protein